jgi:hypothetical protein
MLVRRITTSLIVVAFIGCGGRSVLETPPDTPDVTTTVTALHSAFVENEAAGNVKYMNKWVMFKGGSPGKLEKTADGYDGWVFTYTFPNMPGSRPAGSAVEPNPSAVEARFLLLRFPMSQEAALAEERRDWTNFGIIGKVTRIERNRKYFNGSLVVMEHCAIRALNK